MSVHYSSETVEWETPQPLFDLLDAEFQFTVDVCATASNAKVDPFFSREQDGLKQNWTGMAWCNPPYGRGVIDKWMAKAASEAKNGTGIVCLVPARTDTKWWHDYVLLADEVRFVRGRIKFGDQQGAAPFPSALVVFRPSETWANGRRQITYTMTCGKQPHHWVSVPLVAGSSTVAANSTGSSEDDLHGRYMRLTDFMERYAIKDRRTARKYADEIGYIQFGDRLLLRVSDVDAWEEDSINRTRRSTISDDQSTVVVSESYTATTPPAELEDGWWDK